MTDRCEPPLNSAREMERAMEAEIALQLKARRKTWPMRPVKIRRERDSAQYVLRVEN